MLSRTSCPWKVLSETVTHGAYSFLLDFGAVKGVQNFAGINPTGLDLEWLNLPHVKVKGN